jgi:hypothetical protein
MIAKKIIAIAQTGVQDPVQISELAIRELGVRRDRSWHGRRTLRAHETTQDAAGGERSEAVRAYLNGGNLLWANLPRLRAAGRPSAAADGNSFA